MWASDEKFQDVLVVLSGLNLCNDKSLMEQLNEFAQDPSHSHEVVGLIS